MKELVFLNRNSKRWKEFEAVLKAPKQHNPDIIADLFIQITDDLAYSRTYYPHSSTTSYLNSLAIRVHELIYRRKIEDSNRFVKFWKYEYPALIHEKRKNLFWSFVIFLVAVLIGGVSAAYDSTFVRIILGDEYVNMTLHNIEQGEPMAVYSSMNQSDMFLAITFNNVRVSFYAFLFGITLSVGTVYFLVVNGVMLGSFQFFFHEQGVLWESILSIWIHGTLEIWAIIISGAAGLVMGNSLLFPCSYSRMTSFRRESQKAVKIIFGTVPIFIIAGFLEGFITRLTQWHEVYRLAIILFSLIFIIWYFIIYPKQVTLKLKRHDE